MRKPTFIALTLIVFMCQVATAQDYKTTKDGYLAAVNKEYFDKMTALVAVKDYQAVQVLLDAGVVIWLKAGMEVQIVETTWTGAIKIRLKGTVFEVWTYMEAVE